jgi:predicted ATP-grasp superfamily ATP-dependent carboligase
MDMDYAMTSLFCAALAGMAGWLFHHSVDRKIHLDGRVLVGEEVFSAKLSALEDRLRGEIAAVKIKIENLEEFTHHIDRRLEKALEE